MSEEYWAAVLTVRLGMADLLDSLSSADWDVPSLCAGWRVRDVAAHVAMVPTITTGQMIAAAPRAGFNPNKINTLMARRAGSVSPAQIAATLRDHAADRTTAKVLDTRNALFDAVVHSQDIALPLGIGFPVSADHARAGLERVWAMGWPFRARRRLAGYTLTATDTEWTVGTGPRIEGSALALLLLLTGRTSTARDALRGPGLDRLRV